MLSLEMLPAAHGDCLWIEYGDGRTTHRILIDGGPAQTYPALRERILKLPADARHFELLVVTHIDGDHIEGIVRLLQDAEALHCSFSRIWFNGRPQLNRVPDPAGEPLGPQQGEMLGLLIEEYEARTGTAVWNKDLPDALAMVDRAAPTLPVVALPGGCALTLLSPDAERLLDLKTKWASVLRKARWTSGDATAVRKVLLASRRLRPLGDVLGEEEGDGGPDERFEMPDPHGRDELASPGDTLGGDDGEPGRDAPFGGDTSVANGSSIALLLAFPAQAPAVRLLLAGDAWAGVLETSVDRLLAAEGGARLEVDAFKLPHHGSVANVSPALLGKLRCARYLVSTSGAIFRHPHARAVDLLIDSHAGPGRCQLHFNYLTETTRPWSDAGDQAARRYSAHHPKGASLSW